MHKLLITNILLFFVLCACSPSQSVVQTAIANTQFANQTLTPELTATPTTTFTPSPTITPTETPNPTFTPTPDLRIIANDPQDFLPKANELPLDAKYFLPNSSWISPHTNSEVVAGWTVKKGQEYIARTGREIGWWVSYARGTKNVIAPEEIHISVVRYKTHEGAMLLLSDYLYSKRYPEEGWKTVDQEVSISENCAVENHQKTNSGGDIEVAYSLSCTYRNINVDVTGYGFSQEVTHEYIENIMKIVLEKLYKAKLTEPENK